MTPSSPPVAPPTGPGSGVRDGGGVLGPRRRGPPVGRVRGGEDLPGPPPHCQHHAVYLRPPRAHACSHGDQRGPAAQRVQYMRRLSGLKLPAHVLSLCDAFRADSVNALLSPGTSVTSSFFYFLCRLLLLLLLHIWTDLPTMLPSNHLPSTYRWDVFVFFLLQCCTTPTGTGCLFF